MHQKTTISLLVVVTLLMIGGYLNAWVSPNAAPTSGNISAALNTSAVAQTKAGNLAANIVAAFNHMRSPKYCDINGLNCYIPGVTLPVCTPGQTLIAGANGQWLCNGTTTPPPPSTTVTAHFITQFSALASDPIFRQWYGAALPPSSGAVPRQVCSGGGGPNGNGPTCTTVSRGTWYDDQGWIPGSPNPAPVQPGSRDVATYNKLCSYLMVGGQWTGGGKVQADYGSDNNNWAYYWDSATSAWLRHGPYGWWSAVDVVQLDCKGSKVSIQGNWWLSSNRREIACSRFRCNPYPAPTATGRALPIQ